jgi:anti-sigma regulatory factor (Ser/Thr protein kinase)
MPEELFKKTFTIVSRNFDKAGENSSEIKAILKGLNFDPEIIRRTVVVAFEAEMNVVMYAHSGTLTFMITEEDLQIEIVDEGPGIPNIEQAMQPGFSTAPDEMREMGFGFGMGLPNIKKHSDLLKIESQVGKGTTLFASIKLNSNA